MLKDKKVMDDFTRKRIARRKKIRKRRIITALITVIILLVCVGIVLSLTVFFPIEKINVTGSTRYTSEQIINGCGIQLGDNLFTVSESRAVKQIRPQLPFVERLEFERDIKGVLNIVVTEAKEHSCYKVGDKYYSVGKDGWVLNSYTTAPKGITEVVAQVGECVVGKEIILKDQKDKEVIDLISQNAKSTGVVLNQIDVTDNVHIKLKADNRFEVILGNENNIDKKFKHLASMIKNISEEKKGKINISMWTSSRPEGTFLEEKS